MTGQQNAGPPDDPLVTVMTVMGLIMAIGHAAALFPDRSQFDWPSAGAFAGLIFLYATLTGPGRRSGLGAFTQGLLWAGGLWFLWLLVVSGLDANGWYATTFSDFRVGLSSRGFGHAGVFFLILWLGSLFLMCAVALAARRLVQTVLARR